MSVPYGTPQQRPGPPAQPSAKRDLGSVLATAAAGLGALSYLLGFFDGTGASAFGLVVPLTLGAALVAGYGLLSKKTKAVAPVAALLATVAALLALLNVKSPVGLGGGAMAILIVILVIAQAAALVVAVLLDLGIVKFESKPAAPFTSPGGWNGGPAGFPHSSGPFPQQPPQGQPGWFGQPGQSVPQQGQQQQGQPGQGQPGQGQSGQPQSGQPGQQQPVQQTAFLPHPGQFTEPGQFGQPGQHQPRQNQSNDNQSGQPGQQPQSGHPGTPPGGFGAP